MIFAKMVFKDGRTQTVYADTDSFGEIFRQFGEDQNIIRVTGKKVRLFDMRQGKEKKQYGNVMAD